MDKASRFGKRTFSSLRIRNYRLYFIGQAISLSGTWMQTIGQSWLVLKLTNSGTALGVVTAMQFLPILLFGPLGGVITDRYPKRKLLFFTQSAAGFLALVLGFLILVQAIQLWMVYFLAVCLGFVNMIDNPTRQTFALEMVGRNQLTNAITLNSAEINMARIIGPALAGILISSVGLAPCFILNGISYGAVLIGISLMHKDELHVTPVVKKMKGQLWEGFKYVTSKPVLRNTLLMMAIIGTLTYEFTVSLPLLAAFTYHGGSTAYAALTASMGIGSLIGALYAANRRKTNTSRLIITAFLFGLVILLTTIAPNLPLAMAGLVLVGILSINFTTLGNVILQLESAPEMRGRVMALWAVAFLGSTPIGGPIIGWIGEHISPQWGLAIGGFAALASSGIGFVTLKNMNKRISLQATQINIITADEQESVKAP